MQADRFHEMEADLRRLRGVHSARIHVENGEITEVHVVADDRRRPKGVVRDVVTTLYVRHGIRIDHQKVSVASSCADRGGEPHLDLRARGESFLRIAAVQLSREEQFLRASVEIQIGPRSVHASQEALATRTNQLRVVAAAALDAVGAAMEEAPSMHLEEVRRVALGQLPVVLVHIVMMRDGVEHALIGCSAATDDRLDAAAWAVLDAVGSLLPIGDADHAGEIEYLVQEEASE